MLRHAGQAARATVRPSFEPGALAIRICDDGGTPGDPPGRQTADTG